MEVKGGNGLTVESVGGGGGGETVELVNGDIQVVSMLGKVRKLESTWEMEWRPWCRLEWEPGRWRCNRHSALQHF